MPLTIKSCPVSVQAGGKLVVQGSKDAGTMTGTVTMNGSAVSFRLVEVGNDWTITVDPVPPCVTGQPNVIVVQVVQGSSVEDRDVIVICP